MQTILSLVFAALAFASISDAKPTLQVINDAACDLLSSSSNWGGYFYHNIPGCSENYDCTCVTNMTIKVTSPPGDMVAFSANVDLTDCTSSSPSNQSQCTKEAQTLTVTGTCQFGAIAAQTPSMPPFQGKIFACACPTSTPCINPANGLCYPLVNGQCFAGCDNCAAIPGRGLLNFGYNDGSQCEEDVRFNVMQM